MSRDRKETAIRNSGGISVFIESNVFRKFFECRLHMEFPECIAFLLSSRLVQIFGKKCYYAICLYII